MGWRGRVGTGNGMLKHVARRWNVKMALALFVAFETLRQVRRYLWC